jgi:predicted TIM-barrel fold metal-dependent hydrolase
MRVIDSDSHFTEPLDWFQQANPSLAAEIPPVPFVDMIVDTVAGDALTLLPPEMRPSDPLNIVPKHFRAAAMALKDLPPEERQQALASSAGTAINDGADRVRWMDEHGIDVQILVPSSGFGPYKQAKRAGLTHLQNAALETYNTWASDRTFGHTDRLIPVTLIDLADTDWAVGELRRMRDRGSRVFQVPAAPVDNKSLGHPDFDRVWSTAEDLGMAVYFHVTAQHSRFHPGWINDGSDGDHFMFVSYVNAGQVPMMALSSLVVSGVLDRHPGLVAISAELGIEWLPYWLRVMDGYCRKNDMSTFFHDYTLPLKPSEYAQRQIRVAVLRLTDEIRPVYDRIPDDILVFSTDWPHPEGSEDAQSLFADQLHGVDDARQERFFGASMAEALAL